MATKKKAKQEPIILTPIKEESIIDTPESLKAEIRAAKDKIDRLQKKLEEMITTCANPKSLYYKADVVMLKSDITNCNATIFLCNEKLKKLEKEQPQPGQ